MCASIWLHEGVLYVFLIQRHRVMQGGKCFRFQLHRFHPNSVSTTFSNNNPLLCDRQLIWHFTKKNKLESIILKAIVILYSMWVLFARAFILKIYFVPFHTFIHTHTNRAHSYTCARNTFTSPVLFAHFHEGDEVWQRDDEAFVLPHLVWCHLPIAITHNIYTWIEMVLYIHKKFVRHCKIKRNHSVVGIRPFLY